MRGFQIVGGPAWVASERFDVEAKAEDAASFALIPKADGTRAVPDAPFLMIRELLKDRFKLVVHRETRDGPVYALMMIRSGARGPGLRPPAVDCTTIDPKDPAPHVGMCGGIGRAPGRFMGRTATMAQLATSLSISLQRPVIDRTQTVSAVRLRSRMGTHHFKRRSNRNSRGGIRTITAGSAR